MAGGVYHVRARDLKTLNIFFCFLKYSNLVIFLENNIFRGYHERVHKVAKFENVAKVIICSTSYRTEGKNQPLVRAIAFLSTLTLGLKINFNQPIKWMEFQKLVEIKWLPVNL